MCPICASKESAWEGSLQEQTYRPSRLGVTHNGEKPLLVGTGRGTSSRSGRRRIPDTRAANLISLEAAAANVDAQSHARQVLRTKAWLAPAGTNVANLDALAQQRCVCDCIPQDLAAAFTLRAINYDGMMRSFLGDTDVVAAIHLHSMLTA